MAQKDYVSRAKRGGQRKRPSGKKKKTIKKAKSSPVMLLLLVAIVVAFVAALYFLKNNKSTPPVKAPQTSTRPKTGSNAIPPAPSSRYSYPDVLTNPGAKIATDNANKDSTPNNMSQEQQRILSMMAADRPQNGNGTPATYNQQVDRNSQNERKQTVENTSSSTPTSSQSWMLQCGSFKNKDGAESIKAQLALSGISSQIVFSGNLHRVMVGPYKTKDAANNMHIQIKNAGVQGCNIRG